MNKLNLTTRMSDIIARATMFAAMVPNTDLAPAHIIKEILNISEMEDILTPADLQEINDEILTLLRNDKSLKGNMSARFVSMPQSLEDLFSLAMVNSIARKRKADVFDFYVAFLQMDDDLSKKVKKVIDDVIDLDILTDFVMDWEKDEYGSSSSIEDIEEEYKTQKSPELNPSSTKNPFGKTNNNAKGWKKHVKDLMEAAKNHNEPLVGRESEIDDTIRILCRKEKSNPLHVGEPGVGKTAITLGLAKRILDGDVPEKLKDKHIYALEMSSLLAGTHYRGDLEQKIDEVLKGAEKEGNVILYIDELHTIVGAGAGSDGGPDVGNMLKTALLSGNISFIGATTYDEYRTKIEKDKALARRFKVVNVDEPSEEETIEILKGIKPYYEEFHNVSYSDEVVERIVEHASKYATDKFFPDKAIDLLDEIGATISKDNDDESTSIDVEEDVVDEVAARTYHIPVATLKTSENAKLLTLKDEMTKTVFGQDEAITLIVNSIKKSRAKLSNPKKPKPIGSFLFVGPTGVGKTEVAKQLADSLSCELVRFNMSEYMEKESAAKLIGSPAGYVGYEDGGLLVEAIRKNPHCVLLFDEIEKAHPSIFNIFLQIMDEATLQDNKGRIADFKNVVVIMTSNAGANIASKSNALGFGASTESYRENIVDEVIKDTFSPEFRARLTSIVHFNPMSEEMGKKIVAHQLDLLKDILEENHHIALSYSNAVVKYLEDNGITEDCGARRIETVIENNIKPLLSDGILDGSLLKKKKVKIDIVNDEPTLI